MDQLDELFAGRRFGREVILLCIRWCLRFKLSLRNLVEMMAERGLSLAYTTIMRWVQHYTPEFEKRWNRHALAVELEDRAGWDRPEQALGKLVSPAAYR